MNKKIKLSALFIIALLAVPQLSQGAHPVFKGSFLPPNNLRISVNSLAAKGLTEKQFNAVIDEIEAIYTPIVAAKGAKLVINRLWDDPTVNSDAEEENDKWIINSYGGLARDQHITQDGFALVACHEMGHHLGGAPKYNGGGDWASNEGEADYFSTSKCLHLMFSSPASKHFTHTSAGNDLAIAKAACAKSYPKWHWKARAVCVRSAMAGLSVTGLLAELSQGPHRKAV